MYIIVTFIFVTILLLLTRLVVKPNELHIVEKRKGSVLYGEETLNGKVYYRLPSWIPMIGVRKVEIVLKKVVDDQFKDFNIKIESFLKQVKRK